MAQRIWNFKGHTITVITGNDRFDPIPVYIDGKRYGAATYDRIAAPVLKYEIDIDEDKLFLVNTLGGVDLVYNDRSLSDSSVVKASDEKGGLLSIALKIILTVLAIIPVVLAFAFDLNIAVKAASVVMLCNSVVIIWLATKSSTLFDDKKRLLFSIGVVVLDYLICGMMYLAMNILGS